MTVDFHVHRPSRHGLWGLVDYEPQVQLDLMDALAIDAAVVLPLDGLMLDPAADNDAVASWCAGHGDRLIGFGTVDPRRPDAAAEVRRCVERLGLRGLKFHSWLQGFHPLEPFMDPVCREAARLGVPLLFHDGTPPYATPLQIGRLAARHPDARFVLGHAGLYDLWPEARAAVLRYPNVYACMTSLHPGAMRRLAAELPADRLLFGSDGGLAAPDGLGYVAERWEELRALGLDEPTTAAITSRTARSLLERR